MNFNELLRRYKEGIANEKERNIVEEELNKYKSIEEYLADDLFEQFFDEKDTTDETTINNDGEIRSIKKAVNRRLGKVVLISVIAVVILYVGVFYGISGMVNGLYYNPTSVTESKEQEYKSPNFYYDMQAYVSLNMPGYALSSFTSQVAKGFGNYELSYALQDLFKEEDQRYFTNISRGKLTHGIDGVFSNKGRFGIWNGFEKIQYYFPKDMPREEIAIRDEETKRRNEETLSYLKELNPLSYISMSVVFDKDLTMKEFYDLNHGNQDLKFKWVGIRTVEPGTQWNETQPMHLIGFNPNYNDEPSSNREPNPEEYPFFYLDILKMREDPVLSKMDYPEAVSKLYETHFRSRLWYLKNRERFVKIFDYNSYKTDFYDDALKYIDEKGVKTYGVLAYGTAGEFLQKINEIPYDSLYINGVLPTRPNIYFH